MFSRTSYWKRRHNKERGQGDDTPPNIVSVKQGGHSVHDGRKFVAITRKQARQKLRSRYYVPTREVITGFEDDDPAKPIKKKVEDKVGRKFTQTRVRHVKGEPKFTGPTFDPNTSNHERVFRQRVKSGRIKLNEGEQPNGRS